MKILWVVNSVLPAISDNLGITRRFGAGWLEGILNPLLEDKSTELVVCFPYVLSGVSGKVGGIKYYSFKEKINHKYDKRVEVFFETIIEVEDPDIIHIFGTEYPHSLAAVNAAAKHGRIANVIINLQGLISYISKHYYANLSNGTIYKGTLRDFFKRDTIYLQCKKFHKRGIFEEKAIKTAKNVIGRTDWDEACVKNINKDLNYYFCNETLRNDFYTGQWDYESCEKHSVFIGSSAYPIKGFHSVLEVFPQVVAKYPDAKIYVPGQDPFIKNGFKGLIHRTYYQVYIKKLISKNHLKGKVVFLGNLSAKQMKEQMLRSNVFILSSSIENSPNTLGEAMLLGVPCIATDVGGVRSLASDKKDALIYPFEENYILPYYLDKIFGDTNFAEFLSNNARIKARQIYSIDNNRLRLLEIYHDVFSGGN